MIIQVNEHYLKLKKVEFVNEKEVNVTKCLFEFDENITDDYVKEAYFTKGDTSYKVVIINNECNIPSEVLEEEGQIELGVVCYLVENEEEIKRYNPSPIYFEAYEGSIKANPENTEPITPSEMEQYEQALNSGLNEISTALDDLQEKVDSGYFKGEKGDTGEQGPQGIQGERGLQGEQGIQGVQGEKGEKGDKGDTGEKGQDGTNGINGVDGRDGVIQYTAGENITIENNVISAIGGGQTTSLGKASDHLTDDTAIDLSAMEVGTVYNVLVDFGSFRMKCTYKGRVISNSYSYGTAWTGLSQMFIMLEREINDNVTSGSNVGRVCWIETDSNNGLLRFRNQYIQIRDSSSGISFSTGTNFTYNIMNTDKSQVITGLKTFSTLPESPTTPTSDNQLVNKAYVDNNSGGIPYYLGKISEHNTTSTAINLNDLDVGLYSIVIDIDSGIYFKCNYKSRDLSTYYYLGTSQIGSRQVYVMIDTKITDDVASGTTIGRLSYLEFSESSSTQTFKVPNITITDANYGLSIGSGNAYYFNLVSRNKDQTITGKKTFNTLPESSVTPTTDNQLVNKKYVDDAIAQALSNL